MIILIALLVMLAAVFGWLLAKTHANVMAQRALEVGDVVRVKTSPEAQIYQRMIHRGIVNTLARAMMGKTGTIIETSEANGVARLKFHDAGSHLSTYYIPHNVLELRESAPERIGRSDCVNSSAKG